METWCFLGILFSLPHNKADVYVCAATRNAIESDFRSSKMAAGGHFEKKNQKRKVMYRSEMVRNVIESDFRSSKMAVL